MAQCPHCKKSITIYPEQGREDILQCGACEELFEIASVTPLTLRGLMLEECPNCYEDLFIPEEAKERDVMECAYCGKRFELQNRQQGESEKRDFILLPFQE